MIRTEDLLRASVAIISAVSRNEPLPEIDEKRKYIIRLFLARLYGVLTISEQYFFAFYAGTALDIVGEAFEGRRIEYVERFRKYKPIIYFLTHDAKKYAARCGVFKLEG